MVNKEDLINRVVEKTNMNRNEVEAVIDNFLDAIVEGLARGEEVKVVRFGKFNVKTRVSRNIMNPVTREIIRAMYMQMGRKPSESDINRVMATMNVTPKKK